MCGITTGMYRLGREMVRRSTCGPYMAKGVKRSFSGAVEIKQGQPPSFEMNSVAVPVCFPQSLTLGADVFTFESTNRTASQTRFFWAVYQAVVIVSLKVIMT